MPAGNGFFVAIPMGMPSVMTKLRVLIIEDEPIIAMLLAEVLTEQGYDVADIASTEEEAIRAAARHRPDIMIVDARLRQGSGLSAVSEIIAQGFIPHVFMSGDRLTKAVLGPEAIMLQKPFQEADLLRAIAQALGQVPERARP